MTMTQDPLVNEDGSIDWPDVQERTYNTLRQSFVANTATVLVVNLTEAANLQPLDFTAVQSSLLMFGLTGAIGLVTMADNVMRQWLRARKRRSR